MNKIKHLLKKSFLPITSVALFGLTVFYWNNQNYGLALEYNGKEIATVSNEEIYLKASEMLNNQLAPEYKRKLENSSPNLKLIAVNKSKCCESPKDIEEKIIKKSPYEFSESYGLYINKKLVAVGNNKENIQEILNKKLNKEKTAHPDWQVAFEENVSIEFGIFEPNQIKNTTEIEKIIDSTVASYKEYTVTEEDNLEDLAQKLSMSTEEILKTSNSADGNICVGDKIKIKEEKNLLNIKIFKTNTKEEETEYSTETTIDPTKEENYKKVTQAGKKGKNIVTYEIKLLNNGQEETKQTEVVVLEAPTTEKITIGVKQPEDDGKLIWPVPFTKKITSKFGIRGQKMHKGIDISSHGIAGKDIVAAGSGIVKSVSYKATGYGNHLIIKHSDGKETLYAHCQSISVQKGDKVKKGDIVAKVGTTGNSTGNHLHFEVIINGSAQDPQKYV